MGILMYLKHRNETKPYISIYYTIKIMIFKDSNKEESYSIIIKTKEMKERNSRKEEFCTHRFSL